LSTTASATASFASGKNTTAAGNYSWAGGYNMQLSAAANNSFVWGHHTSAVAITEPNVALFFPSGTAAS